MTGVLLLAATVLFTTADDRSTSWADWGYLVTLSVAFGSGLAFRQWWKAAIPTVALVTVYLLTTMPAPVLATLVSATRTLLDNVRWHARAGAVVVHATVSGGGWELAVTDDGIGFDPTTVTEGYGLSQQVRRAVAGIGGTVEVVAAPGSGAAITLRSRRDG